VQFFANRMNEVVRTRFDIEAALRQALERDEFVLHYQPLVVLPSGVITGFEALVRWQHPERGLLLPDEFMQIAESTELVVALGEWVIGAACREASRWQRHARQPVHIAVNVSAQQLRDKRFVDIVKRALATSGLDPHLLEIEITENTIMGNGRDAIAMLEAIGRLGVQVGVDDFGTGYSSLSYLKRLPIDTVKIDKSFVADLAYDADAKAIVSAIVALAHNLGLRVIAEGVETEAQLAILHGYGCDGAQGYMFGRAQPPERLILSDVQETVPHLYRAA
jgi:EAL domain-containing protein (putative c-di-GMP-specific phosphodiesterase class I)